MDVRLAVGRLDHFSDKSQPGSGAAGCRYLFGFHVFGLGFLTSMLFVFATGASAAACGREVVAGWYRHGGARGGADEGGLHWSQTQQCKRASCQTLPSRTLRLPPLLPPAAGVFTSSWIGSLFVGMGENIVHKVCGRAGAQGRAGLGGASKRGPGGQAVM